MVAWSSTEALPADSEARLTDFTELVATAIANTEARREVERLVEEQVALRRVATLVARGVPPSEVFETVTREVGLLCGADLARMERYESDGTVTGVGVWSKDRGHQLALGTRIALEGVSIAALVQETGRPMRVDSFARASGPIAREAQELGIRSSVGCPIVVQGRLWGVIAASSKREAPFPAGHRVSDRRVHRARGDGDLEHRSGGRGGPARGRAGRPAAGGDAGGARAPGG